MFGKQVASVTTNSLDDAGLREAVARSEALARIAPEDPSLWHELAEVRLDQKQYGRAEQLAAKSNALAGPQDDHLRTANWSRCLTTRS